MVGARGKEEGWKRKRNGRTTSKLSVSAEELEKVGRMLFRIVLFRTYTRHQVSLSRRRNGKKIIWIGHEKKLDEKQGGLYLKRGIFGLK